MKTDSEIGIINPNAKYMVQCIVPLTKRLSINFNVAIANPTWKIKIINDTLPRNVKKIVGNFILDNNFANDNVAMLPEMPAI
jgi:hypothetical protein